MITAMSTRLRNVQVLRKIWGRGEHKVLETALCSMLPLDRSAHACLHVEGP